MSVLIHYARSGRHEAADQLRRAFVAAGFEAVQVVYGELEMVEMPSGEQRSYHAALQFLSDLDTMVPVQFQPLPHGAGLDMPTYASTGAAGMDLRAAIAPDDRLIIPPSGRVLAPTGFNVAIPQGYEMQVRSRSGLAAKHGVFVLNAPGTIDADYRGEIKVILFNAGADPFNIARGDRIAQAVLAPVVQARWVQVDQLDVTARGSGGFGSTGRA